MDFQRHRPRVILLEAVAPGSMEDASAAWERDLLAQGYRFAFFDRLNRFYVAEEAKELAARLPAEPAPWDKVRHLWDCGRAPERPDHPDHVLARTLMEGFFAELPSLDPALRAPPDRARPERGQPPRPRHRLGRRRELEGLTPCLPILRPPFSAPPNSRVRRLRLPPILPPCSRPTSSAPRWVALPACTTAGICWSNVIPAEAGIHATIDLHLQSCVGARLRGHDVAGVKRAKILAGWYDLSVARIS